MSWKRFSEILITRVDVGDFLECWNLCLHLNICNKNTNKLSHFYTMSLFFFPYSQIHGLKIKIKKKQNISKPTPSFQKKSPQTPSDCPLIKSSGPLCSILGHELVSLPDEPWLHVVFRA